MNDYCDEVEIATHYIHWAMCELSWNKDTLKSVTVPISLDIMNQGLNRLKIKFVRFQENEVGHTIVTFGSYGLPTTYLSPIHAWIQRGTIDDNFTWQQKEVFDFTPVLEANINLSKTENSSEIFSE